MDIQKPRKVDGIKPVRDRKLIFMYISHFAGASKFAIPAMIWATGPC